MYSLEKNGAEAARKSDTGGGSIKELGKYIGSFTQAVDLDTKKGGKGMKYQQGGTYDPKKAAMLKGLEEQIKKAKGTPEAKALIDRYRKLSGVK